MFSKKMHALGTSPSVIRDLFEYGNKRKAEIGADKVFDFSRVIAIVHHFFNNSDLFLELLV